MIFGLIIAVYIFQHVIIGDAVLRIRIVIKRVKGPRNNVSASRNCKEPSAIFNIDDINPLVIVYVIRAW